MTLSDTTHSFAAEIVTSSKLVANIKPIIASERKKSIRKHPGRMDERLEPRGVGDEWICAPVTRSHGRRNSTMGKKQKKKSGPRDNRSAEGEGSKEGEGEAREKGNRCVCGGLHQWNWNLIHKWRKYVEMKRSEKGGPVGLSLKSNSIVEKGWNSSDHTVHILGRSHDGDGQRSPGKHRKAYQPFLPSVGL